MKRSKCEWGKRSIEYLGYVVGHGQLSVPQARARAIEDFKRTNMIKQMRCFLGTIGYYRRFIPDFARYSKCLNQATHKDQPNNIVWTDHMSECFMYFKSVLSHNVQLKIPTSNDSFVLTCDASMLGVGAVLNVCRDGSELPVSFYSMIGRLIILRLNWSV